MRLRLRIQSFDDQKIKPACQNLKFTHFWGSLLYSWIRMQLTKNECGSMRIRIRIHSTAEKSTTYRGRLEECPVKRGDTWARCWRCRYRTRHSWPLHSSAGVVPRRPCCRRWAPHCRRYAPRWSLGAPGRRGRGRGASSELSAPDCPACHSSAQLFLLPCAHNMESTLGTTLIKKKEKFPHIYHPEGHIWLTAYSYMTKYLRISSYIWKPFLIHIWLGSRFHLNFLINEENFLFFSISVFCNPFPSLIYLLFPSF